MIDVIRNDCVMSSGDWSIFGFFVLSPGMTLLKKSLIVIPLVPDDRASSGTSLASEVRVVTTPGSDISSTSIVISVCTTGDSVVSDTGCALLVVTMSGS